MRVSEMQGEALDMWVAKAEGHELTTDLQKIGEAAIGIGPAALFRSEAGVLGLSCEGGGRKWNPSTDWSCGGPIIERERINLLKFDDAAQPWCAVIHNSDEHWIDTTWYDEDWKGPTPLIAAMRAFVASVFGEEVPDLAMDEPVKLG